MLLSIEGKSLMKIIEMVYCSNFTLLRFTTERHHPKKQNSRTALLWTPWGPSKVFCIVVSFQKGSTVVHTTHFYCCIVASLMLRYKLPRTIFAIAATDLSSECSSF